MIPFLSLVTSVKDYVEIVHKLIESDSSFKIQNYDELGPIITYLVITVQEFIRNFVTLNWLNNIWTGSLPIIIPDISSSMVSEISILDNYFHNAFNFLDKPISYGESNLLVYNLEKFSIGLINSLFLFIPTGTSHLITIRRFVMQGLEAGYLAGLGSIVGNIFWITSVIFGFRFFVIPWLSLDIFRYILGFVLLVKYMWDSYNERKMAITTQPAKQKIFLLNLLLALTEQTSIYPFVTNISIGSESSILESFPAQDLSSFVTIHCSYILGLTIGCLSLLHLTCWFWEKPAFKIYMWLSAVSPRAFKVSTSFYYKVLNFTFLYLTMLCAISSIPYYGLDYTLTNPLGLVHDDRVLYQTETMSKAPQFSFLGTKASDRNTRRNRGRHGRRERWKRRIRKYRTFDASLYDQGVYDLFTIEDLNYGFDRFWLRRKMRNHRVRFRFFPGPWMRSFKKQLAKPRLESYAGPRQEFFRILFEQVYHPSFHVYSNPVDNKANKTPNFSNIPLTKFGSKLSIELGTNGQEGGYGTISPFIKGRGAEPTSGAAIIKENLKIENSTLRKFVRKMDTRLKMSQIYLNFDHSVLNTRGETANAGLSKFNNSVERNIAQTPIYSKRWKQIFSKISHTQKRFGDGNLLNNNKALLNNLYEGATHPPLSTAASSKLTGGNSQSIKKQNSQIFMNNGGTNQDEQILKYRSLFLNSKYLNGATLNKKDDTHKSADVSIPFTLFHPLKIYQKQQQAFEKKLHYYTPTVFRKFSIENNAPYFRVMMKRYFYYYKPTLRWERTMKVASLRKARRKTPSHPRKNQFPANVGVFSNTTTNGLLDINKGTQSSDTFFDGQSAQLSRADAQSYAQNFNNFSRKTIPTHNYTIVGKRASRYRYQIYKDVLQHWYYTPFNRLLLKFDIDLFINRQPKSHFLTKNEENLLHLRRFLLSEHYNTLRWYTQMEHYRSMKTKIGGTKSFVSGIYNQQFSGTFKKIRHLFAITPSQGNKTVLKFDQPLYNEYLNNSENNVQKNLIIHEELLTSPFLSEQNSADLNLETLNNNPLTYNSYKKAVSLPANVEPIKQSFNTDLPKDIVNQSTQIIRKYLNESNPIKQAYIKKLLQEKNYVELTNFLYKGRKIRGLKPITNASDLYNQEKEYLLTSNPQSSAQMKNLKELETLRFDTYVRSSFPTDLWVNLLKKWKRKINDQEFLKNYLQRRIEKREKRKLKKEKTINSKLERLETIGFFNNSSLTSTKNFEWAHKNDPFLDDQSKDARNTPGFSNTSDAAAINKKMSLTQLERSSAENKISTGVQKSLNDGLLTLKTDNSKQNSLELRSISGLRKNSLDQIKNQFLLKQENELSASLAQLSKILKKYRTIPRSSAETNKIAKNQLKKLSRSLFAVAPNKLKKMYQKYQTKTNKILKRRVFKIFTKSKARKDNFKAWQEKERTLNKQKRMRKEFKPLSKNPFKTDSQKYDIYLDQPTLAGSSEFPIVTNPARKKIDTSYPTNPSSELNPSNRNETNLSTKNRVIDEAAQQQNEKRNGNARGLAANVNQILKNAYSKYIGKKFKRKKSPQRRVRVRKNRAVIKKRTLNERSSAHSLKREFKKLRMYKQSLQMNKTDLAIFSSTGVSTEGLTVTSLDQQVFNPTARPLQRRSKQKKQRFWKQKRVKYSQKLRKYKKRRRSVLGKIRILNKQLKRIKATNDLKVWWWKNFLPNLRATTDSLWQYEKDRQIQQKLLELSIPEILERDQSLKINGGAEHFHHLQIGDFDYKPLAIPEALRLRQQIDSQSEHIRSTELVNQNGTETFINGAAQKQTADPNSSSFMQPSSIKPLNNYEKSALTSNEVFSELRLDNEVSRKANHLPLSGAPFNETDTVSRIAENYLLSTKKNGSSLNMDTQSSSIKFEAPNQKTTDLQNATVLTSPIPFYAGWDESLRKFVVTNRLLSRRDSGYEMNLHALTRERLFDSVDTSDGRIETNSPINTTKSNTKFNQSLDYSNFDFTAAPLKGMNTATTLYWQIPFTTYDPDQFFALGMDGFAPLGWRRFQFRHSILKSWLYEKSTPFALSNQKTFQGIDLDYTSRNANSGSEVLSTSLENPAESAFDATKTKLSNTYIVKNKINIWRSQYKKNGLLSNINSENLQSTITNSNLLTTLKDKKSPINLFMDKNSRSNLADKNTRSIYRRLKKRYRRVKKHPRSPVWFPSGPLLNQVLPVHYIYIFYKRSRLPRDRYIKRRLVKSKAQTNSIFNSNSDYSNINPISDFTLRKRVKTKRKYHVKQDLTKQSNYPRGDAASLIPRRVKFIAQDNGILRWRPLSRQKITKPIADLIKEKRLLRSKQRKKELQDLNSKQPTNIRIKQLRRRVQRQIIRSVWRYKPHAGGFVWPGDYLKLELVKAPKLNIKSNLAGVGNTNVDLSSNISTSYGSPSGEAVGKEGLRAGPLKVKRKKKRTIQEWQIQPKKYLLQKHNYNVIKKKLAKAQRLNKIHERKKELSLTL
jgi:hypothetical protein